VTRVVTVLLLFFAVMVSVPGAYATRSVYARYTACHAQETRTGIATRWSLLGGCHATILGTDLKVGP
jgi:hypothetical protein